MSDGDDRPDVKASEPDGTQKVDTAEKSTRKKGSKKSSGSPSRSRSRRKSTSKRSGTKKKGDSSKGKKGSRSLVDDDDDDDDDGSLSATSTPTKTVKKKSGKRKATRRSRTSSRSIVEEESGELGGEATKKSPKRTLVDDEEDDDDNTGNGDGDATPNGQQKAEAGIGDGSSHAPESKAEPDNDDTDTEEPPTPRGSASSSASSRLRTHALAVAATIKKKPSYFAAFINSRTLAGQEQAGQDMTWKEACCGSTEMKKSRSLRLQAMHSVFNSIFTLVFIVLLSFALVWLERYYVNYFRASSVLLNYSDFELQLQAEATAGDLSTTSAPQTTMDRNDCNIEDCFAGYSCDALQMKGIETATCAVLELEHGCSCLGCVCALDTAQADPPYIPPPDEDLTFTDDGYDYDVQCADFAATTASCAQNCSCSDEEIDDYCQATYDTQGGANECVMLPIRSDGSCSLQLKSVAIAPQLGLDRSPRFEDVVGIDVNASELLYTHRTGCCQDQRDGSLTDAKGTFFQASSPDDECPTILFDPSAVGLADSVKLRLALSIYPTNASSADNLDGNVTSVSAGIVVTMPIKFFAVSPGLTMSAFVVFALVIVFAVLQAATNERALARLRKIGNKIPCFKGLSNCFRGAAGFLDVVHMFIDVFTFFTFLISLGVLASWMSVQLADITACVNASEFSALSFSPYYYSIPSWNFLDNATEESTVVAQAAEAEDAGDLPPDSCDAAAINRTAAYLALLDTVVDEMVQTLTICGDPAVTCEVDDIYMETYYFSIQFVLYLVGAAAISLFFVIVFDIGWVVARFMIARVTFVQENACRSCQCIFDISKLPRKCALCTFFYCRRCTFQTRIIPGYSKPQHVCTMCMLQSRQSIIRELEDICEAGARKNRAVVGLVHLVIKAVQASRRFNLTLEKYDKFLNNGKRSTAVAPTLVVPSKSKRSKAAKQSPKHEEFRINVTRFRSRRIFAELREVVGYLWQETFVEDVKASTQVMDDGFGGVLEPDVHRDASLRELLRHAVKEMLRNLDDRSIMHRFMTGLTRHYSVQFLHTEYEALEVQASLASSTASGDAAKHSAAAAAAAVADDDADTAFYRQFLRRVFTSEWWSAMAKALSSYAERNAFSEARRTQMKAIDDKADRSFRSTFELVPPRAPITTGEHALPFDTHGADTAVESKRNLAQALHAFWMLPPDTRASYFGNQADIACRSWYERLLLGWDQSGIETQQAHIGSGVKFTPKVERMYFDRSNCRIAFRQRGNDVIRAVRVVVFQDFFAVFSSKSIVKGQGSRLTDKPAGDSQAKSAHLMFMFFFKELDLVNHRSSAAIAQGISENDLVFSAYDLEFWLSVHKPALTGNAGDGSASSLGAVDEVEHSKLRDLFHLRCIDRNLLCELHPYESTFPEREDCLAKMYINGAEYFDDVAHAMLGAQHTIMIADWCISPFIYLQRPHHERDPARGGGSYVPREGGLDPAFRLDNLLQRKAAEGVQVYILLFKELSMVLDLYSEQAEVHFKKLHKNIHVTRHCPTKLFDRTGVSKSWSHHQKFVVVDNTTSFVGGIDLCAGRFDTHLHPLYDPLPPYLFPAADYKNPQVASDCNKLFKDNPYPPVLDLYSDIRDSVSNDVAEDSISIRRGRLRSSSVRTLEPSRSNRDMDGSAPGTTTASTAAEEDARKKPPMPRMPWHDIHSCVFGKAAEDAAENFIMRWNAHNAEDPDDPKHQPIWPKAFFTVAPTAKRSQTEPAPISYDGVDVEYGATELCPTFPAKVQTLRSAAGWSGWRTIENSIQRAYIEAINNSKHYIYIENQFFISKSLGLTGYSNTIAKALQARVINAIDQNSDKSGCFKLVIVIPLHMDGALSDSSTTAVLQHMQRSIYQDELAFFKPLSMKLMQKFPDTYPNEETALEGLMEEYVMFVSLRQWQRHPVRKQYIATSQIYIHSKLLVIDDRVIIVGSANINDRSMIGDRDTELAVRIEGTDLVDGLMDGQPCKVSKQIRLFRERLWRQNFGLEYSSGDGGHFSGGQEPAQRSVDPPGFFADPVKQYTVVYKRCKGNTDYYREMFPLSGPHNACQARKEVKDFISHHQRDNFFQYLAEIVDEEKLRKLAAIARAAAAKSDERGKDSKPEASQLRRTTEKRLRSFEKAVKGHGVLWPMFFARKYDFNKEVSKAQMAQLLVNPMFFV